jgi:hypothetical protein
VDAASVALCECRQRMTKDGDRRTCDVVQNLFSERERRWAHSKRDAAETLGPLGPRHAGPYDLLDGLRTLRR